MYTVNQKMPSFYILFGYLERSLCSIVRPFPLIVRSFHNTIVRTFYKFKSRQAETRALLMHIPCSPSQEDQKAQLISSFILKLWNHLFFSNKMQ